MSVGMREQFESGKSPIFNNPKKPWQVARKQGRKLEKRLKHQAERRKAKADPEAVPAYRRYCGYEY
jgi:hypothetical protein